jgi:hypothetical protein
MLGIVRQLRCTEIVAILQLQSQRPSQRFTGRVASKGHILQRLTFDTRPFWVQFEAQDSQFRRICLGVIFIQLGQYSSYVMMIQ